MAFSSFAGLMVGVVTQGNLAGNSDLAQRLDQLAINAGRDLGKVIGDGKPNHHLTDLADAARSLEHFDSLRIIDGGKTSNDDPTVALSAAKPIADA